MSLAKAPILVDCERSLGDCHQDRTVFIGASSRDPPLERGGSNALSQSRFKPGKHLDSGQGGG